ncbi:MAG: hypothetical protein AB1758_20160 [Candidatus Eremiobacterota bacterium]
MRRILRRRGINLIEVLIAFVVLAVAFLALIEVFPSAYMASAQAKDMMVATQVAQAIMDEEMTRSFDQLANRGPIIEQISMTSYGQPVITDYQVMVQVTPPVTPAVTKVRIMVNVQYRIKGANGGMLRFVQLESSRTRTL